MWRRADGTPKTKVGTRGSQNKTTPRSPFTNPKNNTGKSKGANLMNKATNPDMKMKA